MPRKYNQEGIALDMDTEEPRPAKFTEAIANAQGTSFYRILLTGAVAALAWYFAQSDATTKTQIQELRDGNNTMRELVLNNNRDIELVRLLVELLQTGQQDHETRIRGLERWQTIVNDQYPGGPP